MLTAILSHDSDGRERLHDRSRLRRRHPRPTPARKVNAPTVAALSVTAALRGSALLAYLLPALCPRPQHGRLASSRGDETEATKDHVTDAGSRCGSGVSGMSLCQRTSRSVTSLRLRSHYCQGARTINDQHPNLSHVTLFVWAYSVCGY